MTNDRSTTRIVGLTLTGICFLCFALSAFSLPQ
jgi:hypothetical protein